MSNEELIAEARRPSVVETELGPMYRNDADLIRRLADALEAAERKPVIDREALATVLESFIEGLRAERRLYPDVYRLDLADAVIASGLIEDKRAVQAEALEAATEEYRQPIVKVGSAPDMVRAWLGVADIADALIAEGWRKMPSDETLWDLASDLLDGLNIEDVNPPSLIEFVADKIRARLMDGGSA